MFYKIHCRSGISHSGAGHSGYTGTTFSYTGTTQMKNFHANNLLLLIKYTKTIFDQIVEIIFVTFEEKQFSEITYIK